MTEQLVTTAVNSAIHVAANSVVWWLNNSDLSLDEALDHVVSKAKRVNGEKLTTNHIDAIRQLAEVKAERTFGLRDTHKERDKRGVSRLILTKTGEVLVKRTGEYSARALWNIYNAERKETVPQ